MQLSFRHRLFLAMVGVGTMPLAVALLVLVLQVRSASSPGPRAALDEIAETGRALVSNLDTTRLDSVSHAAVRVHTETITRHTTLARREQMLSRYFAGALGFTILVLGAVVVAASLGFARRWSRLVSTPTEELVDWVRRIQRGERLPLQYREGGAPEFGALRIALQDMSEALAHARRQELEQERLRAFRETSRRVAHEMRGPLTAMRFALAKSARSADATAASVLAEETARLEEMAREFSEFGRLPEGPEADIDVGDLVRSAVAATVPAAMAVHVDVPAGVLVRGHYEPLRRAVQNLLQNAVDVTDRRGVVVTVGCDDGWVRLTVRDYGPGVATEVRNRAFEPYFTTKDSGTGLGLALARQTVLLHGGSIDIDNAEDGGAVFQLRLRRAT